MINPDQLALLPTVPSVDLDAVSKKIAAAAALRPPVVYEKHYSEAAIDQGFGPPPEPSTPNNHSSASKKNVRPATSRRGMSTRPVDSRTTDVGSDTIDQHPAYMSPEQRAALPPIDPQAAQIAARGVEAAKRALSRDRSGEARNQG
jgi:hypothetical protein